MGLDFSFGERHIYVGSAPGVWGGLQKRREQHICPKKGQIVSIRSIHISIRI